jgi:SOS response regulatory protein OraA/RecX
VRAGVGEDERTEALARLERIGYLDDGRFAAGRAQALAERGYGDAAIRHELEREGIGPEELDEALTALEPEPERAAALVARHGATAKTAALLARRGFDPDSAEAALRDPLREDGSAL